MSLSDRVFRLGAASVVALFLVTALIAPVFADAGDLDGFDGDEIVLPIILGVAVLLGVVVYFRSRRSRSERA